MQAVMDAPLAGNVDDPEGSLDALMQVTTFHLKFSLLPYFVLILLPVLFKCILFK